MASNEKWVHYREIGGMNTSEPTTAMQSGESVLLQNVAFLDKRVWSIRPGRTAIGSTISGTPPIDALANLILTNGNDYLVACANNKLYSLTSTGGTFTDKGALIKSGLFCFETFNNLLVIGSEGTAGMNKFDGTTLAALGDTPSIGIIGLKKYQNYLFAQKASSSTVYFSAEGNPESWDEANDYFVVNKDDGDFNAGLAVWGDRLLMFKRYNTYYLSGYSKDTFATTWHPFLTGVGCVNPRSIQEVGDSVIWQSDGKIYRLRPSGLDEISFPIRTTMGGSISKTYRGDSLYYPKYNQYMLAVDTAGIGNPDSILVFDLLEEKWSIWAATIGMESLCTTTIGNTQMEPTPVGGALMNGNVYNLDSGTSDSGGSFAYKLSSREFDCGAPFVDKLFSSVFIWIEVANIATVPTVDYYIDGVEVETGLTLTAEIANKMYPVKLGPLQREGKYLQLIVNYTGTAGGLHIGGYSIGYKPAGAYR